MQKRLCLNTKGQLLDYAKISFNNNAVAPYYMEGTAAK